MTTSKEHARGFLVRGIAIWILGAIVTGVLWVVHPVVAFLASIGVIVFFTYALFDAVDGLIIDRINDYQRFQLEEEHARTE